MHGLTEFNATDQAAAEAFTSCREVSKPTFCCPNPQQLVVSVSLCGLNNPEVVHIASDRPAGLIDVTVDCKGAFSADPARVDIGAFC